MALQYSHSTSQNHVLFKTGGQVRFNGYSRDLFFLSQTGIAHFKDLKESISNMVFKIDMADALAEIPDFPLPDHTATFIVKDYSLHLGLGDIENKGSSNNNGQGVFDTRLLLEADEILDTGLEDNEIKKVVRVKTAFYVNGAGAYINSISYKIDLLLHWTGYYQPNWL